MLYPHSTRAKYWTVQAVNKRTHRYTHTQSNYITFQVFCNTGTWRDNLGQIHLKNWNEFFALKKNSAKHASARRCEKAVRMNMNVVLALCRYSYSHSIGERWIFINRNCNDLRFPLFSHCVDRLRELKQPQSKNYCMRLAHATTATRNFVKFSRDVGERRFGIFIHKVPTQAAYYPIACCCSVDNHIKRRYKWIYFYWINWF